VTETTFPIANNVQIVELLTGTGVYFTLRDFVASLVRQDGSTLYSQPCASYCFAKVSGERAVVYEQPATIDGASVASVVDLVTGRVVREFQVTAGEEFEFLPFPPAYW
jgi:hypothetical protein